MALEDICSFKGTHIFTPAGLYRPLEDAASNPNMPDRHNLGRSMSKASQLNSGIPLHFSIPTIARPPPLVPSTRTVKRPFPLSHGTTTLGFIFKGGVIAAADSRASAGGLVACPSVQKITPVHSHLVVTSSGSGADCMLWERILAREIRLYQLRHKRCLSINGTAKMLSLMLHPFKGTDVCVALTLCGWDKDSSDSTTTRNTSSTATSTEEGGSSSAAVTDQGVSLADSCTSARRCSGGPKLVYVCSDGMRLQGDIFSVGSGSPYAYAVLDGSVKWELSRDEAVSLAREAVFRATHRDAYSGNNVDLFHVTAQGWTRRERENLREEYYKEKERIAELVRERKRGMLQTSSS